MARRKVCRVENPRERKYERWRIR